MNKYHFVCGKKKVGWAKKGFVCLLIAFIYVYVFLITYFIPDNVLDDKFTKLNKSLLSPTLSDSLRSDLVSEKNLEEWNRMLMLISCTLLPFLQLSHYQPPIPTLSHC